MQPATASQYSEKAARSFAASSPKSGISVRGAYVHLHFNGNVDMFYYEKFICTSTEMSVSFIMRRRYD